MSFDEDYSEDGEGGRWVHRPIIVPSGPSIIVEGPDRVGKTTIVQHIANIAKIPAFKCPSEKEIFKKGGRDSLTFDYTLTHFLKQTGYRFVSDRGYPSELVYSKVFNRETDWEMLNRIDEAHFALKTKIVYLYSSVEPLEKDDLVPDGMYWQVKEAYDYFNLWSDCRIYKYDTSRMLQAYQDGGDISKQFAEEILRDLGVIGD